MVSKPGWKVLIVILLLAIFLRVYNMSDLSGGDDSQWAELAMYAIKDPALIAYPAMPNEPVAWSNTQYSRPFAVIPYVSSILLLGYTKLAVIFPSIIFTFLSIYLLFILLNRFFDQKVAYLATFFFAISPFHLAFSRIGLLDASLIFYSLLSFWLLIKGLEEKKAGFIYLSALVWFINLTTTNIRGAVSILAILPCIYVYIMKKKWNFKKLVKNRLFHHLLLSHFLIPVIFLIYLALPLLWNDPRWWNNFVLMVQNALGIIPGREYLSFSGAIIKMGSLFIFTPLLGIIFIPFVTGLIISIYKIKNFRYSFWVFYFIAIVFFYSQGQFAPQRQVIFLPAIATFAAIGIIYPYYQFKKQKNTWLLPTTLALIFGYFFIMLVQFSNLFSLEFKIVAQTATNLGLAGLLNLVLSFFYIFIFLIFVIFGIICYLSRDRQKSVVIKSVYLTLIAIFLFINLVMALMLVHTGIGVYKRTDSTGIVGNYLKQNLQDEKYSCVAGVQAKSFSFYTQKPCAFWIEVDVPWLSNQTKSGNLRYFVLNTHYQYKTPGFGNTLSNGSFGAQRGTNSNWSLNYQDKYDWLHNNTIEITHKILPNTKEYIVYELK